MARLSSRKPKIGKIELLQIYIMKEKNECEYATAGSARESLATFSNFSRHGIRDR